MSLSSSVDSASVAAQEQSARSVRSPVHGTRLAKAKLREDYEAIIIGSGISGLATAVFLAGAGRRVLVLDKHYTAGGYTHTFRRRGYEWNTGVHHIGRVHQVDDPLRRVFDHITDGGVSWQEHLGSNDRIVIPDQRFDMVAGADKLRARLHEAFPDSRAGIDRYLHIIEGFSSHMRRFAILKVLPPGLAKIAGPLVARRFNALARRTTSEVLDELFDDERLKAILTARYGNYGLPPARSSFATHAMVEGHFLDGASYPKGGATRIAGEAVRLIESLGGQVVVQAGVEQILSEGGRARGVRLCDGRTLRAPLVISSTGARNTYAHLLKHEPKLEPIRQRLSQLEPSTAHVCLYLGFEGSPASLGLERSNLWIHAGRDHDAQILAHERDPRAPFPVVFVSAPKICGPASRKTTLELIVPTPFQHFARWAKLPWKRRGADYEQLKNEYGRRLLETFELQHPGLSKKVAVSEVSTPLSTSTFSGHRQGQMYGIGGVPARYREPALRPHTPIRGLYMTGQDALVPGIGGALMAGLLTSSIILRRNLLGELCQAARPSPSEELAPSLATEVAVSGTPL